MKYYIIAGEASGDLHASNLMRELRKRDPQAEFRCWGGDLMEAQGGKVVKHYRDLAFMGFTEVLMNLRTILSNITFCKQDILASRPDVLVLVDYPGFNLRIAEFAHENNFKVIYYISPQVWAWKQSRVKKIKRVVDRMLVILPFEKEFYSRFDLDVSFTGHPLLDAIEQRKSSPSTSTASARPYVVLLPGSRMQEISTMLPLMLGVIPEFPQFDFVIGAAPSVPEEFYRRFTEGKNVSVVPGKTYDLLEHAYAALVTSGTATLETALFRVPEVVCYKGGMISYFIARSLVKIKFISLVNLIMDKEVVRELIQDELTVENLKKELKKLTDPQVRERLADEYTELHRRLGGPGASSNAADIIYSEIRTGK